MYPSLETPGLEFDTFANIIKKPKSSYIPLVISKLHQFQSKQNITTFAPPQLNPNSDPVIDSATTNA